MESLQQPESGRNLAGLVCLLLHGTVARGGVALAGAVLPDSFGGYFGGISVGGAVIGVDHL